MSSAMLKNPLTNKIGWHFNIYVQIYWTRLYCWMWRESSLTKCWKFPFEIFM